MVDHQMHANVMLRLYLLTFPFERAYGSCCLVNFLQNDLIKRSVLNTLGNIEQTSSYS